MMILLNIYIQLYNRHRVLSVCSDIDCPGLHQTADTHKSWVAGLRFGDMSRR